MTMNHELINRISDGFPVLSDTASIALKYNSQLATT